MVTTERDQARPEFAHAVSTSAEAGAATSELLEALGPFGRFDLLLLFVSAHLGEDTETIAASLRRELSPRTLVAVTADAVIAGGREFERSPGVAALAGRLPGVALHPFASPSLEHSTGAGDEGAAAVRTLIAAGEHLRAALVFADPFSTPMNRLLPLLNEARSLDREGRPVGSLIGGMASGGAKAEQNVLVVDDRVLRSGFAGVSLSGPVSVDTIVSQGCRPIGENMVITKAKANVIYELGGHPALEVVRGLLDSLGDHDRRLLRQGLFVGRVVTEYKDRFGRGDYLIRNVAGVNPNTNIIAVQDLVRVGQTVRFHVRDAQTAAEDLELLLDGQRINDPPAGVLLISCTGRGRNLFRERHHDASAVQGAFRRPEPGEVKAKGGTLLESGEREVPLAGFFAAGEIGPVGDASYLHGHSACAAIFR